MELANDGIGQNGNFNSVCVCVCVAIVMSLSLGNCPVSSMAKKWA